MDFNTGVMSCPLSTQPAKTIASVINETNKITFEYFPILSQPLHLEYDFLMVDIIYDLFLFISHDPGMEFRGIMLAHTQITILVLILPGLRILN